MKSLNSTFIKSIVLGLICFLNKRLNKLHIFPQAAFSESKSADCKTLSFVFCLHFNNNKKQPVGKSGNSFDIGGSKNKVGSFVY